jgi:hypothetical protein
MYSCPRAADPKRDSTKKGAAVAGGSKVNREASNRVDRSHSMSRSMDNMTNGRESLTSYEDLQESSQFLIYPAAPTYFLKN